MPHNNEAPEPVRPLDHLPVIECPCCHGRGKLVVHDEERSITQLLMCRVCEGMGGVLAESCTHCMGAGKVMADA
jgi:DnaJ-class molecular chaperone